MSRAHTAPEDSEIVVAGAVRTPIGKFGGALSSLTAAGRSPDETIRSAASTQS